jgi:Cu/Ag efflux pump CusA
MEGRDVGAALGDVQAALDAIAFPLEYHAEVFSAAADRQAATLQMLGVLLAVLAGIVLILQAAFSSWRLAASMLLILPAAASGGALGLLATGGTISLGLLAGFVAVIAIATRQIVTLIDRYRHLERAQAEGSGLGLILQGGQERMGPVLTTALATIVALLPILVLGDIAGLEVLRPMAAVMVGGLLTSTFMTLFIVPTVYLRSGPSPQAETMSEMLAEGPGLSPA